MANHFDLFSSPIKDGYPEDKDDRKSQDCNENYESNEKDETNSNESHEDSENTETHEVHENCFANNFRDTEQKKEKRDWCGAPQQHSNSMHGECDWCRAPERAAASRRTGGHRHVGLTWTL